MSAVFLWQQAVAAGYVCCHKQAGTEAEGLFHLLKGAHCHWYKANAHCREELKSNIESFLKKVTGKSQV